MPQGYTRNPDGSIDFYDPNNPYNTSLQHLDASQAANVPDSYFDSIFGPQTQGGGATAPKEGGGASAPADQKGWFLTPEGGAYYWDQGQWMHTANPRQDYAKLQASGPELDSTTGQPRYQTEERAGTGAIGPRPPPPSDPSTDGGANEPMRPREGQLYAGNYGGMTEGQDYAVSDSDGENPPAFPHGIRITGGVGMSAQSAGGSTTSDDGGNRTATASVAGPRAYPYPIPNPDSAQNLGGGVWEARGGGEGGPSVRYYNENTGQWTDSRPQGGPPDETQAEIPADETPPVITPPPGFTHNDNPPITNLPPGTPGTGNTGGPSINVPPGTGGGGNTTAPVLGPGTGTRTGPGTAGGPLRSDPYMNLFGTRPGSNNGAGLDERNPGTDFHDFQYTGRGSHLGGTIGYGGTGTVNNSGLPRGDSNFLRQLEEMFGVDLGTGDGTHLPGGRRDNVLGTERNPGDTTLPPGTSIAPNARGGAGGSVMTGDQQRALQAAIDAVRNRSTSGAGAGAPGGPAPGATTLPTGQARSTTGAPPAAQTFPTATGTAANPRGQTPAPSQYGLNYNGPQQQGYTMPSTESGFTKNPDGSITFAHMPGNPTQGPYTIDATVASSMPDSYWNDMAMGTQDSLGKFNQLQTPAERLQFVMQGGRSWMLGDPSVRDYFASIPGGGTWQEGVNNTAYSNDYVTRLNQAAPAAASPTGAPR